MSNVSENRLGITPQKQLKLLKGEVVSISQDTRTIKVLIPRIVSDARYGKTLRRHTALLVDSAGVAGIEVGKEVSIVHCARLSKRKSWKIVSVLT